MEPAPVTRTARRTVRVAIALVVGQALLCAVIGWVTFGAPGVRDRSGGTAVDPVAVPPLMVPPPVTRTRPAAPGTTAPDPVVPTPVREMTGAEPADPEPDGSPVPAPPDTSLVLPSVSPSPRPEGSVPAASPPASSPASPPGSPDESPLPSQSTTDTNPEMALVSVSPSSEVVLEPVALGTLCRPEGAYGRTADGTDVRCLRTGQRELRWKIVSAAETP